MFTKRPMPARKPTPTFTRTESGARPALLALALLACSDGAASKDTSTADAVPPAATPDAAPSTPDARSGEADARPTDAAPAPDAALPDLGPPPEPLAALPHANPVSVGRFMTHEACAFCHLGVGDLLRDADGLDISPVGTFLMGAMAHSARDPYYLAAFAAEMEAAPASAREDIEATCTRCHAPAARVEKAEEGDHVRFDDLVAGTADVDHLARDGVTCTACHQIRADGLGTPNSFTGGYRMGKDRLIYGPYTDPFVVPMQNHVNYTPTGGAHMARSALCGTCHTVLTRPLDAAGTPAGPVFPEQATYLEWRNSNFRTADEEDHGGAGPAARSCQDCHMPSVDHQGRPLETIVSIRPGGLDARTPFRRHDILGGNAWLPRLLAADPEMWQSAAEPGLLEASAGETEAFLRAAATLRVDAAAVADGVLTATAIVQNLTGHKLPTGYPTRRMFLSWQVLDASGAVLLGAGEPDADGRVAALAHGVNHVDQVTTADQVPAWGTRVDDLEGRETHLLLKAARWRLDNRLLPQGWRADGPDAETTASVGVTGDADFEAGGDRVHFAVPVPAGAARLVLRLWMQPTTHEVVNALARARTPAGERLRQASEATPPRPVPMADAEAAL
jgi:hypothetical protein